MNSIVVLMSTYNGHKFIEEQLNSIFRQKNTDINLVIRDDGSTDQTISIIKEYKLTFGYKIELIEGENIGWRKSFFELLNYAQIHYKEHEYFAFADQDDIWLPDKLYRAVSMLKSINNIPALYCSNLFYYKDGINYGRIRKHKPIPSFENCLVRNYATGCTIVFNKPLLSLVTEKTPSMSVAHDYWLYQAAVLCGEVIIDDEAYILYRQHENNQIGNKSDWQDIWKRRWNDFKHSNTFRLREIQSNQLLDCFANSMKPDARRAVEKIAFYRKNIKNQFSLLFDNNYTLGRTTNDLWMKLRILLRIL